MSDAGRWHRVKGVFQDAIARPPEARETFLAEACAEDAELRSEVDSLLAAQRDAGAFLSEPAVAGAEAQDLEGRRIGPYLIQDRLGHGGMGVVYRAIRDDDVFHKIVALKLVRGGAGPDQLRRLAKERQILARLQHPHIATILDGGATEDGEPYLVMEHVVGVPIDAYCNARGLGVRERLEIFRAVCGAVHYAHQNLVVHRDLKPQNILVTAEGQPKLLDFGIAKLLAGGLEPYEMPTATLLPMMTPEYASPEQVRGEPVTTASDLYSLGVVLYELLSGRLPLEIRTDSLEEILRSVCETEPPSPSAAASLAEQAGTKPPGLAAELRGDLDTIVLKALRKEPLRRYSSAQDLAEDIERHLDGRPVLARKDTLGYRFGKFAGRHRAGLVTAALLLVSLVGGLGATAWQWRRAERRFADVRQLAHSVLFEFDDAIKDLPGSTKAREILVKRALEYLDSLAREGGGDPTLERELAMAYHRVADVQGDHHAANLGDSAGALGSYRKALAIQERLVARTPADPELRLELARLYAAAGDVQQIVLRLEEAQESYRKALAIQDVLSGASPPDATARRDRARTLQGMAEASNRNGDVARAEDTCRKAVAIQEGVVAAHPNEEEARRELASSYQLLGNILSLNSPAKALEQHRRALEIRESLLARSPESTRGRSEVSMSETMVGNDLGDLDDLAGGMSHFQRAVSLMEQVATTDPDNAQARWLEALALNTVGDTLRETGHAADAVKPHEAALTLLGQLSRADPSNDTYRYNIANTDLLLGQAQEALARMAAPVGVKRERWAKAQAAFAKSAAIFVGMRERGTLSAQLTPDADRVDRALLDCQAALAKLAPAPPTGRP
jgi:non-specific serine/threonine protein kinase/serine/threonine-protein kinase